MTFSWKARYTITIGSSEKRDQDINIDDPTEEEILSSPFYKGDRESTRRYIVRRRADAAIARLCERLENETGSSVRWILNGLDFLEDGERRFTEREITIGLRAQIVLAPTICLLLAPAYTRDFIKELISPLMQEYGIKILSIDDTVIGTNIIESIQGAIEKAEFIIVDLTRISPNVMYELGFAHALKKPTFIMMEQGNRQEIPYDIAGYYYIIYDRSAPELLINSIKDWITRLIRKQVRSDSRD